MLVAMRDPIHFRLSRTALWACLAVWVAVVGGGCAKDKRDTAMEKLARGGFAFSVDGFHRAAREDNAAMAEHFLAAGMAVDVKDNAGYTPLGAACETNAADVVAVLLKAGAGVSVAQPGGRTPLMLAAAGGSGGLVRLLLEHGADPKQLDPKGWHPLGIAVWNGRKEAAEVLVAQASGAELDESLMLAALRGDVALTDLLLRRGASVMARDGEGRTALMLAARDGHGEVVRILLDNGANRFTLHPGTRRTAAQFAAAAAEAAAARGDAGLSGRCQALAADLGAPPRPDEQTGAYADPRPVVVVADGETDDAVAAAVAAGSVRLAEPLAGASIPATATGLDGVAATLRLDEYRERPMPVLLDSVAADGKTARFRRLFGAQDTVEAAVGAAVPGTSWKVVEARRKIGEAKDDGSPQDLSTVRLEAEAGGGSRRLAAGGEATADEPVVVLGVRGGRQPLVARRGDTFRLAGDPATYRIADIGPDQVVVEDASDHRTVTLRRRP